MPPRHHVDGVAYPSDWWGLVVSYSSTNPRIMSSSCAGVSYSASLRHSLLGVPSHLPVSTLSAQRALPSGSSRHCAASDGLTPLSLAAWPDVLSLQRASSATLILNLGSYLQCVALFTNLFLPRLAARRPRVSVRRQLLCLGLTSHISKSRTSYRNCHLTLPLVLLLKVSSYMP